jgi:hypothetical protein
MKIFKIGMVAVRGKSAFSSHIRFERPWWSFLNSKGFIFPGGYFHVDNYRQHRENGDERDNPQRKFPQDGDVRFVKGRIEGIYIHAVKNESDDCYECVLVYIEGVEDKKWMIEKDGNYLERIEREGRLKELEPLVNYLRELEHATGSIREWWAEKVLLPELYCLFEKTLIYKRFLIYDEFRHAALQEIMEKANTDGEIKFTEFHYRCMEHVKGSFWYNNTVAPYHLMYDHDVAYLSFSRMYIAISACPAIKTLDLSGINLRADVNLVSICRLFKERNDFTKIILANTGLNNERLDCLLTALNFNLETRGIPLIEHLVLADNEITCLSNLMVFLNKYIAQYVKQQQAISCTSPMIPPPLTRIDLCYNKVKLAKDSAPMVISVLQSYEQKLESLGCPLNLTIDITANILAVYSSPRTEIPDVQPEVLPTNNEYVCKFFVSSSLLKIRSRIQPEKDVTKEIGFVYLMCRNYKFPEHVSIIIEMLNSSGQIILNKLELCVNEHKEVKIKNAPFDALKLSNPLFFNHVNIRGFEVSTQLIKKLIDDVNADIANCTIQHSLFGRNGHNCATWAAEKLRNIGLDMEDSILPVVVVTGKDFKSANGCRL